MTRINSPGPPRPDFFLLGAPKCGTTAMATYLAAHPQVHFSEPKEPKYFHTDFHPDHRLVHSEEAYLDCFGDVPESAKAIGEATVWYLYSCEAVPRILEFQPDARFLVMVRNPVDLCHSLHAQLLFGGDEDENDFETAWRLQSERAAGRRIPAFCRDAKSLLYGEVARQGGQLARLYSLVPRERVHVVVFDDFSKETQRSYDAVVSFLGLDPHPLVDAPRINASRKITLRPVASVLRGLGWIKRRLGIHRSLGVWRLATPLISRRQARVPLSAGLRRELVEHFAADVDRLASLLDRDLSGWKAISQEGEP